MKPVSKETELFFIGVLADFLNERKTEPRNDINWMEVMTLAKIHKIAGIFFYQCRAFIDKELVSGFGYEYSKAIKAFKERKNVLTQLDALFTEEDIPFYLVKGPVVAEYYPLPALRTMHDMDIIVSTDNITKAIEALEKAGIKCNDDTGYEKQFRIRDIDLELHDHLLYEKPSSTEQDRLLMNQDWDYVTVNPNSQCCILNNSFHFLFLLLHLRKHILISGAGFRQFMDLNVMMKRSSLDWEWLKKQAEDLGLERFMEVCIELCNRWFDNKTADKANLTEEAFDCLTQKILYNGIDGSADLSNKVNIARHRNRGKTRFQIILNEFFPDYQYLRHTQKYRILDGRPWLLPAIWVYRFFVNLRRIVHRESSVKGIMDRHVFTDDKKSEELLNQMGIYDARF